jgi:hypothetical protein
MTGHRALTSFTHHQGSHKWAQKADVRSGCRENIRLVPAYHLNVFLPCKTYSQQTVLLGRLSCFFLYSGCSSLCRTLLFKWSIYLLTFIATLDRLSLSESFGTTYIIFHSSMYMDRGLDKRLIRKPKKNHGIACIRCFSSPLSCSCARCKKCRFELSHQHGLPTKKSPCKSMLVNLYVHHDKLLLYLTHEKSKLSIR